MCYTGNGNNKTECNLVSIPAGLLPESSLQGLEWENSVTLSLVITEVKVTKELSFHMHNPNVWSKSYYPRFIVLFPPVLQEDMLLRANLATDWFFFRFFDQVLTSKVPLSLHGQEMSKFFPVCNFNIIYGDQILVMIQY